MPKEKLEFTDSSDSWTTAKFFFEMLKRPVLWLFLLVGFVLSFSISVFVVLILAEVVMGRMVA